MAEEVNVHASGSWVGDTLDEFKKLPMWGKIIAGLVVVGVIVYAIHVYSNRNNAASNVPTGTTIGNPIKASNYPQDSSAPIPYQPTYNVPVGQTPTATTPPKPSLFNVLTRGLWSGESDNGGGGAVPIWTSPNADWSKTSGGIPLNQQIQVGQSVQGNYFGKPATYYPVSYTSGGQTVTGYIGSWDLGSTPPVASTPPPGGTPVTGTGSSGDSRIHVVQYGENMSEVARAYGLKSWRDFNVSNFWHGQRLEIPA